jgi:hypothetical protein
VVTTFVEESATTINLKTEALNFFDKLIKTSELHGYSLED